MLGRKGKSLKDVVAVLKEFSDNVSEDISEEPPSEERMEVDGGSASVATTGPSQKAILGGLIEFLESC